MTKEQLKNILEALHLDYDARPWLVYVFYETDDGLINNLSVNIRHGRCRRPRKMSDRQLAELMQQYPDAAGSRILAIERPEQGLTQWMDAAETCKRLRTSRRTLRRWAQNGLVHPSKLGNRLYFDPAEVEHLLRSNMVQQNGRADVMGS